MSVVNKMLKDLDDRGAFQEGEESEYVESAESKRVKYMVMFIAAVVLAAASYFSYRILGEQYFVDLYVQVSGYFEDDKPQPKESKKVKVNSALDQMMPTRNGTNSEPPEQVAETVQSLIAKANNQDSSISQNATTVQTNEPPQPVGLIPDEKEVQPIEVETESVVASVDAQTESDLEEQSDLSESELTVQVSDNEGVDVGEQIVQLRNRAAQAVADKNIPEAIHFYSQIVELNQSAHDTRKKLAVLYYSTDASEEAKEVLSDGVDLVPQRVDFRLMLARLYYREGSFFDAYEVLEDLEPDVQSNIDYYGLKANVAKELEEFAEASHIYVRLALFEPNRAQWWLGLAVSLDKIGQSEGALKAYENAIDLRQLSASADDFIRQRILALGG
ncbi:MAG: hypothetical protein GJ680_10130 [Alteromonadaceae bacterium]|nr:hypothetical protein [Alteromonadaceae bacterium]